MTRLVVALVLTAFVAAIEFWGGFRAGSLALGADAVHVCMDFFALALALAMTLGARRPANRRKTFGYGRLEILGALGNGTLLLGATIFIVYEAILRFFAPQLPQGRLMTIVACIGLAVNAGVGLMLMRDGKHNLNVRAVLFHVAGDAIGAVAVIVAGLLILFTRAAWIDPLLSLFVAGIIVSGVWHVLREAADVLLEGAPRGIDTREVLTGIRALGGVVGVHDLHVWTIGTSTRALSAHVLLDDRRLSEASLILRAIEGLAREHFGITHTTVQFECESCEPDTAVVCSQYVEPEQKHRTS